MTYIPPQVLPLSSFGDQIVVNQRLDLAIKATYGLTDAITTFSATGGSATASNAEFLCQTGTSSGGYGVIWSRYPLVYMPGVGVEARITARFTAPVANSFQATGLFSAIDGLFFGYNGTSFGVMHRYGGSYAIRTLTVTAASGTSVTATVTLNGVAYTAPITSGTAAQNAREIADGLLAGAAASLWYIQQVDSTVVFTAINPGPRTGTYSATVPSGTFTATVVQTSAGVTPTETWVPQASWNVSTASWLDKTKGNLFKFEFAYLGYGPLKYYIFNPTSRSYELVHVVDWTNANTTTNFRNPSLRVGWVSSSSGSTTNLTVAGASGMAAHNGGIGPTPVFGGSSSKPSITTEVPLFTLKSRRQFGDTSNNGIILPTLFSISTDSTKGAIFRVIRNATLTGPANFQYTNQSNSTAIVDTTATGFSGGKQLAVFNLGPSGSQFFDLKASQLRLAAGDTLTITASRVSGAAAEMGTSLIWTEEI
jgi:hypothetical protein